MLSKVIWSFILTVIHHNVKKKDSAKVPTKKENSSSYLTPTDGKIVIGKQTIAIKYKKPINHSATKNW